MPSVEDLLSNPGSSRFYLNHRFYYAIGNTPSIDLTEGCQVPRNAKFLLLGCGDIRNILQTVRELSQLKPPPKSLIFHLNDIDDVLLARNAVLLQIVNSLDPSKREDVEFLWNVWYNLHLSEDDFERLKSVLSHILDNKLPSITFESDECSTAIKTVVKYWLKMKMDVKEAQSRRESFLCKKVEADNFKRKKYAKLEFSEAAHALGTNAGFFPRPRNMDDFQEVMTYFYNGSTDDDSTGHTNPTFFCPHVSGWRVHPASLPYRAFGKLTYTFADELSLKDNCILQLQSQLTSWKSYTKTGALKVSFWDGDALTLCYRRLPCDTKFHFINASNLCDHITLLNVLLACSGRLERNGLLAVQTMHLVDERGYDGSVERYLEAELGLSANYFPTFLGLHLAEDFELGTSDTSSATTVSFGFHELTTRWIASESSAPIISLEGDSLIHISSVS